MSKTIVTSLLPALAVAFTLNLHAEPAWTKEDVAPGDWTAIAGNLLDGLTGTKTGTISTGYGTTDMGVLTDGVVPTVNGNETRVAFQNTGAVEWSFTTPKTLEQVRVSGCYLGGSTYTRISISAVYVKLFGSDTWTTLEGSSFLDNSGRSQNVVICASLADPATGYLAQGVAGLKVAFGANVPLASYIVEIEAVGSAESTGPVIGSFAIAPVKTKAKVSGTIADVGTDATACDVYLSLDGGAATKIAEDVTDSFEYLVQGLTAGTTYAYELSVSNNAPTSRGTVQGGDFTTLAADASTMLWTSEDIAPDDWVALANNALAGKVGVKTAGAIAGTNYATDDSRVMTDGEVPKTGGAAYIYGFQNGCTMEWTLDNAITLESLRLSAAYLAGTAYSKLAVGSVSVKTAGSDEWTPLDAPAFSDIAGRSSGVLICATLSEIETGVLAENVTGIKIVFGNVNALGSYVGEIEAVGHSERKRGLIILAR